MSTCASNLKALADVAAGVDPMPIGAAAPDAPTAPIEPAGLASPAVRFKELKQQLDATPGDNNKRRAELMCELVDMIATIPAEQLDVPRLDKHAALCRPHLYVYDKKKGRALQPGDELITQIGQGGFRLKNDSRTPGSPAYFVYTFRSLRGDPDLRATGVCRGLLTNGTPTQGTIKREHLKASLVVVHVAA
jgi:hypothetical protein